MGYKKQISFFLFCILVAGCVSKNGTEDRFNESKTLALPALNISIPDGDNFCFGVVGDIHTGTDTARLSRILTQSSGLGDAFFILLGDIVDTGEKQSFDAVVSAVQGSPFNNKVLWLVGNHDVFYDGWTYFKMAFGPSHYSLQLGNAFFIALDTADGQIGEVQTEYLKTQLDQNKLSRTFLLSHYLPTIPGKPSPRYLKFANEQEAARMMNLVTKKGVTGWLGAHYHSYIQQKVAGVDYLVAGGGGGRRMDPESRNFWARVCVATSGVTYKMMPID